MEFDVLKELAKTVNKNKIKHIEVLGNSEKNKSKADIFFEGLISDKFVNEKDIVRFFFKTYDTKHPPYIKLKNRLIHQITNTALFIDINQPAFNERAKAYYLCYKDFSVAVILMARSADKAAMYLFQLVLEKAIKYEFVDIATDASRMLRYEYARTGGDIEKSLHYSNLHRKFEEKRRYDMIGLDYCENLMSHYVTKRSPDEDIHRLASTYFDELYPLVKDVDTSSFYRYVYHIGIIKYIAINDTKNALDLCNEAIDFLKGRENTHRSILANFVLQKIGLYIQLRSDQSENVKDLVDYCLTILEEGSFTWFRLYEVYFYYCAAQGQYFDALDIYKKVTNVPNFGLLGGSYHDNWLLLGGYLHLLAKLNTLDSTEVELGVGKFRYTKLFNEIEVLKKDKEGMNIPLIFLPVLYELAGEPHNRKKEIPTDALEKYRQRWLAKDINRRSNSFVKILISLAQNSVPGLVNERKIKKEWEIIKKETPEIARQNFAIEVIPYETLLELLFSKLGLKSILE